MNTIIIPKTHKSFSEIKWVCKAMSNDATRYAICHTLVEVDDHNVKFIATDGRRLHTAVFDISLFPEIKAGSYAPRVSGSEVLLTFNPDGGNFPNWREVIPKYEKETVPLSGDLEVSFDIAVSKMTARLNEDKGTYLFSDASLAEALGQGTLFAKRGSKKWEYMGEAMSPLLLESENLLAVIMPMRDLG